jgi:hypothetical protein
MTDHPIPLDRHRGIAAQNTTELRRQLAEVEANQNALRARQNELEAQLIAASALSWCEAGEKDALSAGPLCSRAGRSRSAPAKADCGCARGFRRLSRKDGADPTAQEL